MQRMSAAASSRTACQALRKSVKVSRISLGVGVDICYLWLMQLLEEPSQLTCPECRCQLEVVQKSRTAQRIVWSHGGEGWVDGKPCSNMGKLFSTNLKQVEATEL